MTFAKLVEIKYGDREAGNTVAHAPPEKKFVLAEDEFVRVEQTETVPMGLWGKDHWSLLAYVETRCVDHHGKLEELKMSCNPAKHPDHNASYPFSGESRWKDEYSTRLRNSSLKGHDDWDCLDDLQTAGLLKILSKNEVKLTDAGTTITGQLRAHKARGGKYADFNPQPNGERKELK